jgi:hypothetical protein
VDGPRALAHAERACELTDWERAGFLDTLAAAYAACGRFDEAAHWARQAIERGADGDRSEFQARWELYEAGRPYRDGQPDSR